MKKCNKCTELKSLNCYTPDIRNKDGLQSICKACRKIVKQQAREKAKIHGPTKIIYDKQCNKCTKLKPISEFYKDLGIADGYATICKSCKNENVVVWREENRDQYNTAMREYNAENYQKLRLQRYKLTPEQHAQMLLDQKGVCAICEKPPKGRRPLCVDHNHTTKAVRGLLCYGCNRALHVLESKELLEKALGYLKKNEESK